MVQAKRQALSPEVKRQSLAENTDAHQLRRHNSLPAKPLNAGLFMVWVITIAVFLATVVAALFVFLIFSQKEQIKKALKEKRKEERAKLETELELATQREPPIYEKSLTENTNRHGARIVTRKRWQPHDHVLVRLPFKNEPSRVRIIYCDALPTNAFAVGLKFSSAVDDWLVPDDDA